MPNTSTTRKANAGAFRKGSDPRRHVCTSSCSHPRYRFTRDDCVRGGQIGFWVALAVYVEKGGNPRNFLRNKMRARGQQFTPRQRQTSRRKGAGR